MARAKAGAPRDRKEKRVRRTPDEARALILDAADTVFRDHLPDAVGLKEIARAAGVSHALVTHYFGTYGGLVEATLERRFHRLRESLVGHLVGVLAAEGDLGDVLATYRQAIATNARDPVTIRLATWALMSGRVAQDDFFSHRMRGLQFLADTLESRADLPREELEFAIVASFALTVGWTVAGNAISGALGRKKGPAEEAAWERRVASMLDAYLQRVRRQKRG
ncbi:MAG: TetR/AcrR family transcriptional regulator [Deltaproteobacteria bacterium]|nr:TetR/AcrR family transcriptional regulator [Deltaproteobacteria bacterium]